MNGEKETFLFNSLNREWTKLVDHPYKDRDTFSCGYLEKDNALVVTAGSFAGHVASDTW